MTARLRRTARRTDGPVRDVAIVWVTRRRASHQCTLAITSYVLRAYYQRSPTAVFRPLTDHRSAVTSLECWCLSPTRLAHMTPRDDCSRSSTQVSRNVNRADAPLRTSPRSWWEIWPACARICRKCCQNWCGYLERCDWGPQCTVAKAEIRICSDCSEHAALRRCEDT